MLFSFGVMDEKPSLTDKQEKFCQEYTIDFNATRAAISAGYSVDTARSIGSENLSKPDIQARIQEIRRIDAERLNLTRERILSEYAKIAFFDIRKIYDENGTLKPMTEIPDDEAAVIGGVKRSVTTFGDEDNGGEKITLEVKVWEKTKALDSLCRMLGYNAADKVDLTGNILIKQITGMEVK